MNFETAKSLGTQSNFATRLTNFSFTLIEQLQSDSLGYTQTLKPGIKLTLSALLNGKTSTLVVTSLV
ncbi:hypothetical protein TREES_T100013168 [Tupaia chinensis]|uniref:Uncharacterized protein n=1 Tax=Tupaia chinensis TaxID=246437 RepID=L9KRI3_TUPCH|nr:hypothetical protein TREES_T100013168 [Tupaia chinensis]